MQTSRGRVVITPKGYVYIDVTNWRKVKKHSCGALNNTEVTKVCMKCGAKL